MMIKNKVENIIKKIVNIPLFHKFIKYLFFINYPGSQIYWEERYQKHGTSGHGSYGHLAEFKADVINHFIEKNNINDAIEFGSGDGNQCSLIKYPNYIGFDVSKTSIKMCKEKFKKDKTKSFFLYDSLCFIDNHSIFLADLTISLDVIYHLIEDEIFHEYMKTLFSCSKKFVIIYSSNTEGEIDYHERRREFTKWIDINQPDWNLKEILNNKYPLVETSDPENSSYSNFYIFEKVLKY
jgi:hypothetical protein